MDLKFTTIDKKVKKIGDFADFKIYYLNHSDLNFHPIFKKLVSKCLVEQLHLRKKYQKKF